MKIEAEFLTSATGPKGYPDHQRVEVALAGRSNVGKSSLVNTLAGRRGLARTAKRPGRTQTLNFYALTPRIALVDLPGYGYAEVPRRVQASWGPMIEGYLGQRERLAAVWLIIDARHGPTKDDLSLWNWLEETGLKRYAIASKWDKVKSSEKHRRRKQMTSALGVEPLLFSAVTGEGKETLIRLLFQLSGESGGSS